MRKLGLALAALLSLAIPAYGQVPSNFPSLPPNSVLGRLGISAGPAQAIPFTTLLSNLSNCPANTAGCLSFGSAPSSEPVVGFWPLGIFRFGQDLSLVGNALAGSANEFGLLVDVFVPRTNSAGSFQKNGIESLCITAEQNPGFTTQKACVGIEGRSYITANNPTGQAYGGLDWALIVAGGVGDGALFGREIDMYNNGGTDQSSPLINPGLRKVGIQIASLGSTNATTAMHIIGSASGGASNWHKGVFAQAGDFVPVATDANASFLELNGVWKVRPDGIMVITYPSNSGAPLALFEGTAHGETSTLFGSFPGSGDNTDNVSLQFWFQNDASTLYNGAKIYAQQVTATAGLMNTSINISTITAGILSPILTAQSNALYPVSDNSLALGTSTGPNYFSNVFSVLHQFKASTALPTCNAASVGTLIYLNNADTITNNATVTAAGANGTLALCAGATPTWVALGGHA